MIDILGPVKTYEAGGAGDTTGTLVLTDQEWWEVFLSGHYHTVPIRWIQPKGDASKRVTFLEHVQAELS